MYFSHLFVKFQFSKSLYTLKVLQKAVDRLSNKVYGAKEGAMHASHLDKLLAIYGFVCVCECVCKVGPS